MLDTLLKIGEWQSEGKSEWDRFLDYPKTDKEDKYGNTIKNYTLPIVFDLDEKEVIIHPENLREYDEQDVKKLFLLRTLSARSKKIYGTVKGINLKYIFNSFFGDDINDENISKGNLIESIQKDFPFLLTKNLKEILTEIAKLKMQFSEIVAPQNQKSSERKLDIKHLKEFLDFDKNEEISVIYVQIKSEKHGLREPFPFTELNDYQNFLKAKFFPKKQNLKKNDSRILKRVCYASGKAEENVSVMDLSRRYSLNKMFGYKTYSSYLTNFDSKKANKNYAVSEKNKKYLDYASDFLLNPNRLVYLAGIKHCFLPEFLSNDDVDLEMAITNIANKSDLLFSYKKLNNAVREIKTWTDRPFWITFLSLEIPMDKKYLKTQNIIKDINVFYFEEVLHELWYIDDIMSEIDGVKWNWVKGDTFFNFYSIYKLIPVREGNTNKAYEILKSIFEGRNISQELIYDSYTELILCYFYKRFAGYSNQTKPKSDNYFNISVRNITFKYHAFIHVLKKLKLIDMEEMTSTHTGNKYDMAIVEFFKKMALNENQQAMFYLGRLLNKVEYLQKDKNKTVIQKVNFNGMDKDDIQRLRIDLIEKAKQYNAIGKVIFIDKNFGSSFDTNGWDMNPKEAVFFLLTGYSFGVGKKETKELNEKETEITH